MVPKKSLGKLAPSKGAEFSKIVSLLIGQVIVIESEVREASSLWEIRQELEKPVNNESQTNEKIEYKHVENQTLEIAKF